MREYASRRGADSDRVLLETEGDVDAIRRRLAETAGYDAPDSGRGGERRRVIGAAGSFLS